MMIKNYLFEKEINLKLKEENTIILRLFQIKIFVEQINMILTLII
jgi:hypothetical protein